MNEPREIDADAAEGAEAQVPGHGLLAGKKGLIVGVANHRSIAWGIARAAHAEGAELAFTFQGEALERRVRPLAQSLSAPVIEPLDVSDDQQIAVLFRTLGERFGRLDFLVHSVAYAEREDLAGRTLDTSRAGFHKALDVSAYSLIALTRAAEPLLQPGSGVLALTYYGAVKSVPAYNVMGIAKAALEATVRYLAVDLGERAIRVNAISAGPIKTLAAAGVAGFRSMLARAPERAPLRRNVTTGDVGGAAVYLLSDLSRGVTGEIHYVDGGFASTAL